MFVFFFSWIPSTHAYNLFLETLSHSFFLMELSGNIIAMNVIYPPQRISHSHSFFIKMERVVHMNEIAWRNKELIRPVLIQHYLKPHPFSHRNIYVSVRISLTLFFCRDSHVPDGRTNKKNLGTLYTDMQAQIVLTVAILTSWHSSDIIVITKKN